MTQPVPPEPTPTQDVYLDAARAIVSANIYMFSDDKRRDNLYTGEEIAHVFQLVLDGLNEISSL